MRYYVVECGYSHNFRFDSPTAAARFMAIAAESFIVEGDRDRLRKDTIEFVIVEDPDEIQEDPEL